MSEPVTAAEEYRSLQEIVLHRLRQAIISGALAENQRLVQDTIAASLGVSKPPVREALRTLESEGLVVFRRGRGAFVASLNLSEADELFMIRGLLEGLAARLAAQNATPTQIEELDQVLQQAEAASGDLQTYLALNRRFHTSLYEASGARLLCRTIASLWPNLERYFSVDLARPGRWEQANAEHRQILQACAVRDADAAERIMRMHIEHATASLHSVLGTRDADRSAAPAGGYGGHRSSASIRW